ncbi:MAG: site-specific DNA-methyltransferase [Chloroflexi bacterium]|nr:site-specific DNA-methyltransferase [Chloroflexota bacterium]
MSDRAEVIVGDVEAVLPVLAPGYTACFCDPPYGLSFMGKHWDHGVPDAGVWRMVCDLILPGGVLLAFGGTRTWHHLAVAIESAGFEIADTLMWVYGSGFPKSHSLAKAIDREAGALGVQSQGANYAGGDFVPRDTRFRADYGYHYAPATPEAATWLGYGTALKPAWEPVLMARKPRTGTYAATALRYGAGALWTDGCLVPFAGEADEGATKAKNRHEAFDEAPRDSHVYGADARPRPNYQAKGRWPANLLLDEESAAILDAQSGYSETKHTDKPSDCGGNTWGGTFQTHRGPRGHTDAGGASRFFYCAKASRRERDVGVPNPHPTVKPLALCEYLARLILPPEPYRDAARLLVPFSGSGSEMLGALRAGWRNVTGVEREPGYATIAQARIAHWRQTYEPCGAEE